MEFYKCGYFCWFFSVHMTKLYQTQASERSIVALLHDYSFFIINYNIIIANLIKHLKEIDWIKY